MPTPRPIIETRIGVIVLMSVRPGEDEQQEERGHQRDDRQRDRNQHRDERAEDDQQHDDRGEQAEQLRCPLLDRRELRLAVVLDGHAGGRDRFADGVLDRDDALAVLVLDRLVELRLRVRDPTVLGKRVRPRTGRRRSSSPACRRSGSTLRAIAPGDRLFDRRLALRRVEPLALRCREDDVQHAALLGGELRLDQVGRLLGVRPWDLELVAQSRRRPSRRARTGAATIPTQLTTTRQGWVAHARVQRASAPVESRSCAASRPFPLGPFVPSSSSVIALPSQSFRSVSSTAYRSVWEVDRRWAWESSVDDPRGVGAQTCSR